MELTKDTESLIDVLFDEADSNRMKRRLRTELSGDLPMTENSTSQSRERIWFAVIRQCKDSNEAWDTWFDLAKQDWRDMLMASDFGHDTTAHIKWKNETLTSR